MDIYFMKRDMVNQIKGDLKKYIPYYQKGDKEEFKRIVLGEDGLALSKIQCEDFTLEMTREKDKITKEDYDISDLKNIKLMYNHLKDNISPHEACDERLWAGMAHTCFWDFIQYRRTKEIQEGKEERVLTSYFYKDSPRRASDVNCVSRLWWAGYYTYDEDNKNNPYEMTDFYFKESFSSRLILLSSRGFMHNKKICLGMLEGLKCWEDQNHGIKHKREHSESVMTYLNAMGSMMLLDSLSREDIKKITVEVLEKNY